MVATATKHPEQDAILAQHQTLCPGCKNLILPDEEDLIVEIEPGKWVHADCVPEQGAEEAFLQRLYGEAGRKR